MAGNAVTEYRLPDALGGHPVVVISRESTTPGVWWVVVRIDDETFPLWLPGTVLEEVVPPLPAEPDPWSVVQTGAAFFERRGNEAIGWYNIGGHTFVTWEQICSGGTPTRLVPDPFAEPVTLPWEAADEVRSYIVEVTAVGDEVRDVNRAVEGYRVGVLLTPDGARAKARALWAAADAAEARP
jgi:hypothetical protein